MLKSLRLLSVIVAIIGVLALMNWFATSSRSFRECKNPSNQTQNATNNEPPPQGVPGLVGIPNYWDCVGRFVFDENPAITAIATALLTVVTMGLLWVGYMQIRTTRAELRAYVFARPIGIPDTDETDCPFVHLEMKNSGKTPAYDVTHWTCLNVDDYPDFKLRGPPGARPSVGTVLPPGGDAKILARRRRPLTEEECSAIAGRTKQIYVWGEISYRDTFQRKQVTKFRLYSGAENEGVGEMAWSKKGNEAT
jgi:hypothetical protein